MNATASPRFNDGNIVREVQFPITLANGQRGLVETRNGVTSYTAPNGNRQVLSAQTPRIEIGPGVVLTLENSVGEISSQNPLRYNNAEVRPVLRVDDTNGNPNKAPLEISFDTRVGGRFNQDGSYAAAPDNVKYADYVNGQAFPPGIDTWTDIDIQRAPRAVQPPAPTPTSVPPTPTPAPAPAPAPTPDPWIPPDFGLPIFPPEDCPVDCPMPEPDPTPAPSPKTPDPWINMDADDPEAFGFGIFPGANGPQQPQPPVNGGTDPWLNQDAPNPDEFGLPDFGDNGTRPSQSQMDPPENFETRFGQPDEQPLEDEFQ
jgi:hypothetical protein